MMLVNIPTPQHTMPVDETNTRDRHFALRLIANAVREEIESIPHSRRAQIINSYKILYNAELRWTIQEAVRSVANLHTEHIIIDLK